MMAMIQFAKPFLLFLLLTCLSFPSFTQQRVDIVKLKNGNVLKGKIIRQVPGQFLELETIDKNYWKFDIEDISEVRFKEKCIRNSKFVSDTTYKDDSTLYYEIKMGVLAGTSSNQNDAPFSLLSSVSYLSPKGFALGLGIGYEAFEEAHLPVYGELKYHYKIKGLPSFFFLQSGYSFTLEDKNNHNYYYNNGEEMDSKGGWMINPGVGFYFGNNTNFSLTIGYRFQKNRHEWHNKNTDDIEFLNEKYHRLAIHLGIVF